MLTDTTIKSTKPKEKPYRLADEKAMYLEVMPNGSKYFRMKYRFEGKEKRLALGVYPETSLRDARDKRDKARKQLAQGIDPGENRKAMKAAQMADGETFEVVAQNGTVNSKPIGHPNMRSASCDGWKRTSSLGWASDTDQARGSEVSRYKYPLEVFWSDADGAFICIAADLPGCSAIGDTPQEAVKEMETAMRLWIDAALSMGRTLPDPSRKAAKTGFNLMKHQ